MPDPEGEFDKTRMSLGEHLDELRRRVIYALIGLSAAIIVALFCGRWFVDVFRLPYVRVMQETGREPLLTVLALSTGFTMYLKISLIAAAIMASPWIFYQIWMFISAGLYPGERRYVFFAAPVSAGLFICGAMFFLFVTAVPILKFFIFFSDWMGLKLVITFDNYINMMISMILVFGLGFQTPLLVLLLARMGIVSLDRLRRYRRHVMVIIVILAALLTPPDPLSQIALALPMWLLYEFGVLLVRLLGGAGREDVNGR